MNPPTLDDTPTLIDELIAEQRQLTAVERFARSHSAEDSPAQARFYRALLPLDKPRPGEQYAFAVDLDSCTGCKACVSACHSLNGLGEAETWRTTGLLHGGTQAEPYQQVVTTACHHCVDPACLNGCPVLAYEKDPATGIVRHLDDQCIGCQYCLLKCPYDVPKFSHRLGIVRKCDMCHGRLAVGEAPACVQACPNQAITIRVVSKAETTRSCAQPEARLVPGAFSSAYTRPATTYASRRPFPDNALPADAPALRLEAAHWPLIGMLLLTQLAGGLLIWTWLIAVSHPGVMQKSQAVLSAVAGVSLHLGLATSLLHLGRPLGAWRAVLGWRRSWMSREILAFGALAVSSTAFALSCRWDWLGPLTSPLRATSAVLAVLSIFSSAMIYIDTRRPFWQGRLTFPRFFGSALLLGAWALALILGGLSLGGDPVLHAAGRQAVWVATVIRIVLLAWEVQALGCAAADPQHDLYRSAQVIRRQRGLVGAVAVLFAVSMGMSWLALVSTGPGLAVWSGIAFLSTLLSQVTERYWFFVAVRAPKMPGGFSM